MGSSIETACWPPGDSAAGTAPPPVSVPSPSPAGGRGPSTSQQGHGNQRTRQEAARRERSGPRWTPGCCASLAAPWLRAKRHPSAAPIPGALRASSRTRSGNPMPLDQRCEPSATSEPGAQLLDLFVGERPHALWASRGLAVATHALDRCWYPQSAWCHNSRNRS